jgi:hypothetical protein
MFVMAYQEMKAELEYYFGNNVHTWNEYKEILDNRIRDVYWGTYVGAGKIVLEMATGRNPSGGTVPYPHPSTLTLPNKKHIPACGYKFLPIPTPARVFLPVG